MGRHVETAIRAATIGTARWARIDRIVRRALDRPTTLRSGYVRRIAGDGRTQREALDLLAFAATDTPFLEEPIARIDGPPAPPPIAGYRLLGLLGYGGMAAVWSARSRKAPGCLAVKVPHANDRAAREALERERRCLQRVAHPCVVTLLDHGRTDDGRPFFAMPRVRGTRPDRHADRRRLTLAARVRRVMQVAATVQAIHDRGIVHADLKPANVLSSLGRSPTLIDFGSAEPLDAYTGQGRGRRAFTPHYAAPEQALDLPLTPATDVHGLGALLHVVLCGCVPTSDRGQRPIAASIALRRRLARLTADEARQAAASRRVSVADWPRTIEGGLDAVLARALDVDPAARYPSARAFERALARCQRPGSRPADRHASSPGVSRKGRCRS